MTTTKLRPPKVIDDVKSVARTTALPEALLTSHQRVAWIEEYIRNYNAGWAAGTRGNSKRWDSGATPHSWDDGYLDAAAGREKWHLTHCLNHDECGEG